MRPVFFYKPSAPRRRATRRTGAGGSTFGLRSSSPSQSSASSPRAPSPRRTPAVGCGPSSSTCSAPSATATWDSLPPPICARPATSSATERWPSPSCAPGCIRSRGRVLPASRLARSATLLAWRVESTILAIFSTAIVASCDEFHQTFLPGRTGSPVDVLLDTAGASALCLLVWLICWSGRARAEALVSDSIGLTLRNRDDACDSAPLARRVHRHRVEAVPQREPEPLVQSAPPDHCSRSPSA